MLNRWISPALPAACVLAAMAAAGLGAFLFHRPSPPLDPFLDAAPSGARRPSIDPARPNGATPVPTARAPTPGPPPTRAARGHLHLLPGSTVTEALRRLAADPRVAFDLSGAHAGNLGRRLGLERAHAEGLFLPASYRAGHGRPASEILREAHDRMRAALADAWHRRDRGLPYRGPYDALIVASIIERETARAADRRRVASVFVRRLHAGMRLQADPTVIYGLAVPLEGPLTRTHLRADTPYNTYTRHGLPPTPISLPGRPAIEAAMQPATATALYFVARGDGSTEFSDTLAQHNAAVRRYLRP